MFVCDQAELYANFVTEFKWAGFQVLPARNLAHAKSLLLSRRIDGVVIRHDDQADDRTLAARLKRITPHVPVFLLTDREQPSLQSDIESIWRGDFTDPLVARGMAMFFRQYLTLRLANADRRPIGPVLLPFLVGGAKAGATQ